MPVDGLAMLEDNDGYHPRLTHWWWAAGAGRLTDGRTAMWNAVVGLNDTLPHIENTVWIDGDPQPIGLVTIAEDLTRVTFDDGATLRFTARGGAGHQGRLLHRPLGLPAAIRHLRRHATQGTGAERGIRGDGGPPRRLVSESQG